MGMPHFILILALLTLTRSAKFVKCDVTKWDQQLALFKDAIASSPSHRVDIVSANAGISGQDDIFTTDRKTSSGHEDGYEKLTGIHQLKQKTLPSRN